MPNDPYFFRDLQEALMLVFTPILHWWLIFFAAGGGISAVGAVILGMFSRIPTR